MSLPRSRSKRPIPPYPRSEAKGLTSAGESEGRAARTRVRSSDPSNAAAGPTYTSGFGGRCER
ncbi:hypothetical protein BN903_17 [Halorubrum sp. AJ67]|nr:hypothetical protein BN903_17 [Halorubrum sp. AJ67]